MNSPAVPFLNSGKDQWEMTADSKNRFDIRGHFAPLRTTANESNNNKEEHDEEISSS